MDDLMNDVKDAQDMFWAVMNGDVIPCRHVRIDFVLEDLDVSPSEMEQVLPSAFKDKTFYGKPLKNVHVLVRKTFCPKGAIKYECR